jgi:heme exporter protein D
VVTLVAPRCSETNLNIMPPVEDLVLRVSITSGSSRQEDVYIFSVPLVRINVLLCVSGIFRYKSTFTGFRRQLTRMNRIRQAQNSELG